MTYLCILLPPETSIFIDEGIHSNSLAVIKTRAKFLNIDIVTGSYQDFVLTDDVHVCGVMLLY